MILVMKKFLSLVFLFALPNALLAGGIGFTSGIGIEHWTDNEADDNNANYYNVRGRRALTNIGLVVDSNIAKRKNFNYRFSLLRETNKPGRGDGFEFTGFSTSHDFGVNIKTTSDFRIWMGPRISIGLSEDVDQNDTGPNTRTEGIVAHFGLGPVVGFNFNSLDGVTFALTYAYLYRRYYGDFWIENATTGARISKQDLNIDSSGSYLNASVIFRFGR
jgi:hypothetical protein